MARHGLPLSSYISPLGILCADDSNISEVVRVLTTNQEQIRQGLVVLDQNQRALYDKILDFDKDIKKVLKCFR